MERVAVPAQRLQPLLTSWATHDNDVPGNRFEIKAHTKTAILHKKGVQLVTSAPFQIVHPNNKLNDSNCQPRWQIRTLEECMVTLFGKCVDYGPILLGRWPPVTWSCLPHLYIRIAVRPCFWQWLFPDCKHSDHFSSLAAWQCQLRDPPYPWALQMELVSAPGCLDNEQPTLGEKLVVRVNWSPGTFTCILRLYILIIMLLKMICLDWRSTVSFRAWSWLLPISSNPSVLSQQSFLQTHF